MANLTRYQPSGFFRPLTLAAFVAAIAGGALAAWLYQLGARWIPIIYLNIILCCAFGGALGGAGLWAVRVGHCRNRMLALVLALPLAAVPVAATYYWDYQHMLSAAHEHYPEVTREQLQQEITFRRYLDLKEHTGWSISNHGSGGTPLTGMFVWAVWAIEGMIIFGFVLVMVWQAVGHPYCERCNRWGEPKKLLLPGLGRDAAAPLIDQGDLSALIALGPPTEPDGALALAFTATLCPACKETGFLSVEEKRIVAKKRGKPEEKTVKLLSHAQLRSVERAQLEARMAGVAAPAPPAAAARG